MAALLSAIVWPAPGVAAGRAPRETYPRTIQWSSFTWLVKASRVPTGPGPNHFSAGTRNVWVDANGALHLAITYRHGEWWAAEIVNRDSLGYGTYEFDLAGRPDLLDPNVVLGLFTWSDGPAFAHQEIDVELSRWGNPSSRNSQFVVQPYQHAGNIHRFESVLAQPAMRVAFGWSPSAVAFSARQGAGGLIEKWTNAGPDVPQHIDEQARINLWLVGGMPPTDGQQVELVLTAFHFTPA